MTTWRKELIEALKENEESFSDIIVNTMLDSEMDKQFDSGYGGIEGCSFTVWTEKYVYFPAQYDGSEWIASVSRIVNGIPTNHIGGG